MSSELVVIWGEVLWDRFPDGARLGGAPSNVAWHLGQAGGWPQLVSRVGDDDDGRRAIATLGAVCDTDLVQVDPERATGEVGVEIEAGEPHYRLVPGRAWERIECTDDVAAAIAEAGAFVYGTLAQYTDAGIAGWRQAMAAARSNALAVCDVNLRQGAAGTAQERRAVGEAIEAADLIKINDGELSTVAAWFGWADPLTRLRRGNRVVALTHGANGSTLYSSQGVIAIAPVPAQPGGDNVGCGDAYLAILVHGLGQGWDLATCGRAASRWAAAVAGERGATPTFSDERVAALLEVE